MYRAREKRLLVGLVALLAPLPLPFAGIVQWPIVCLYWLACAFFLRRAQRGAEGWLPAWAMNLLAIAYLPVLFVDLGLFWRGRLLQPLVHLAMFTLLVKLFALKREADKWHALLGAFFLYLAAMGSSVHPSVVVYQLVMLAVWYFALICMAGWHEVARAPTPLRIRVPLTGFITAATLATLVAAVPLFVLLPRLRQPYVAVGALRTGGSEVAGFSDEVGLDSIGRVQTSSAVAFRFTLDRGAPPPELRFKGGTYDLFRDAAWRRSHHDSTLLRRNNEGWFRIAEGRPRSWMEIWLGRRSSDRLALPGETVVLDIPTQALSLDDAGLVSLLAEPAGTLGFRAGLASEPVRQPAREPGPLASELDTAAVTERMARLAAEVMGEGPPVERARRLERYLMSSYEYSLDLGNQPTETPVDRFLFVTRSGHCEYFASSMVLLLRSQGIPARFVTGYFGAEFNPIEGYFIVRLSNAHAWVEAWLPESGWTTFDPTPPAALAEGRGDGWAAWWSQAADYLVFRWDRYVLTYGFSDQADFFFRFRDLLSRFWARLHRDEPASRESAPATNPEAAAPAQAPEPEAGWSLESLSWLPLVVVLGIVGLWLWRVRRAPSATEAYARLRREIGRRLAAVESSTPPLEVERQLARHWPEARGDAARVVELYLNESFGGMELEAEESSELEEAMSSVMSAVRRGAPVRPLSSGRSRKTA